MLITRILGVAVLVTLSSCCKPLVSETLPVTLRAQEESNWCWAASGEMVSEFITGGNVQQCAEVNRRYGRNDCCNNPTPAACNRTGWPDDLLTAAGLTWTRTTDSALSLAMVKSQISRQSSCWARPFAFTWRWTNGGGHMMVARGYRVLELRGVKFGEFTLPGLKIDMVQVNNPLPVDVGTVEWVTYANYVSGAGHTHWHDYHSIRVAP
jgi:hypothetical protein